MYRTFVFTIAISLILLPQKVFSDNFDYETKFTPLEGRGIRSRSENKVKTSLLTGFTYGKRSQSNAIDEESPLGEFHYYKYRSKIKQDFQKFGYDAAYELYNKDYQKHDDLHNRTHASQTGLWGILWKKDTESLKIDADFDCRVKRFENNPDGEYDKIGANFKLSFEDEDLYSISGAYGLKNFDFRKTDKDEFIQSGKVELKNFFFEKKLSFLGSYKLRYRDRDSEDDRIEQIFKTGLDIKTISQFLKLLRLRLEHGKDNTKAYFDEDDYQDFRYIRWYARTEHKLTNVLLTSVKFEQFLKDYKISSRDYRSHSIGNNWDWNIFKKNSFKIFLNGGYGFRYMDYDDATSLSYRKHSFQTKIKMDKKKWWKMSVGFKWSDYDYYNNHDKDKTSYSYLASIGKVLLENKLKIYVDYKHKFKHYHHRPNINEDIVEVGFRGSF